MKRRKIVPFKGDQLALSLPPDQKPKTKTWVTTSELATDHGVSPQTLHRLRKMGLFNRRDYKVKNPLAARPTYLFHRQRCLKKLETLL